MTYITNLIVILAILAGGYAAGTRRYTAVGCRRAAKWNDRFTRGLVAALTAAAFWPIVVLISVPTYHIELLCCFEPDEAIVLSVLWTFFAMLGFGMLVNHLVQTGEYNSRVSADRAARSCQRTCRYACEDASWGKTILDTCENPYCSCPLEGEFDIRTQLNVIDILAAMRAENRRQRQLRRRGEPVPTATYLRVPCERLLTKEFDAEDWFDGFVDPFANIKAADSQPTDIEPVDADYGKVIPFPGQPAAAEPVAEPIPVDAEIIVEQPTPKRVARYSKFSIDRGDHGIMVKDCGSYLLLRLKWTDENGRVCYEEQTFDKASPECTYVAQCIVGIDSSAAKQLEYMAVPAVALKR